MRGMSAIAKRVAGGLGIIAPGIAWGTLLGSVAALLMPTAISFSQLALQRFATLPTTKVGQLLDPWFKALVAPNHLMLIGSVIFLALGYIGRESLRLFLQRCYRWSIYEGTLLWATCFFLLWTQSRWWRPIVSFGAILLTCVISWRRDPSSPNPEALVNLDRPIQQASEDKLDRGALIVSLVNRLLEDAAPVVALVGAFGDGKTSILNLLAAALRAQNVAVVSFKSSLPGDDLTLVSTLFNSIAGELRRRFFIRRLSTILKRFARKFSGLVPSAPSGLKDIFSEPSQQDELEELTSRLGTLPVPRVVVLLDDMDRMQGSELRTLLRIIRAADTYPRLSFVCAFNKKALVDALIRHQVTDRFTMKFGATGASTMQGSLFGEVSADDTRAGYEYLEKFFPVQVPVPKLDDAQLAKEFDRRFNQFAERQGLPMAPEKTAAFDKEFNPYWKPLFRPALNNLRKMNAYFNALNSSFILVQREVNVIDFMFLELLRQLDPEMYEQVFRNRSLFYYPEWDLQRWDERFGFSGRDEQKEEEHLHSEFDEIFARRRGADRDNVLSLLGRLFPKVAKYQKGRGLGSTESADEAEADKEKRIYHPYYFMVYFSLHVEEGYLSTVELDDLIGTANRNQNVPEVMLHFREYLRTLKPAKRYRFFEKMTRSGELLGLPQSRALATSIAFEADSLEYDELDIGEFGAATKLVLILANRFRDTPEIFMVLRETISQSATDAFALRVLQFGTNKERNRIFEKWDNVGISELESAFLRRLKEKYHKGGTASIYAAGTFRDWQALIWWARHSSEGLADVQEYLKDEFERRPSSIGKHVHWLWSSLSDADGKKLVDSLFSLSRLAEMAKARGPAVYSTEPEKRTVLKLIAGEWPQR